MSLSQTMRSMAYMAARHDGESNEDAKRAAHDAAQEGGMASDAVKEAFALRARQLRHADGEARRLRRERDALLSALATALDVSEMEAWQIARLDLEEDE